MKKATNPRVPVSDMLMNFELVLCVVLFECLRRVSPLRKQMDGKLLEIVSRF